jgi:hypothetical protein
MKKILAYYFILTFGSIYSQNDEFNLFPLNVGNVWVYSGSANIKLKITGTTVLNGHLYYIFEQSGINCTCAQGQFNPFLTNSIYPVRIDSANCNLLFYTGSPSCPRYPNESVKDSLKIKLGDTPNNNCFFAMCNDTSITNIFGSLRRSKTMGQNVMTYFSLIKYVYGIGIYQANKGCFYSGCGYTLNGCLINGTVYGDTSFLTGISQLSVEIPDKFSLYQNYPNPFNPVTKIRFDISGTSAARTLLSVYDLLGREVAVLVKQQLQPGSYEADWDASAYPSGVYYCKLEIRQAGSASGSFTETKKMVLIK